jgi:hypothetical protein
MREIKKGKKIKDVFKIIRVKDLSTLSTLFASGCHHGMVPAKGS